MTDAAGKACPRCGHTNKLTAKNCTQCGAPFYLADVQGEMRKRCAACGHFNRLTANVCTRCGAAYAKVQIAARGHKQKWCPQCGAPRKMTAKACSRCGYRFVIRPAEAPVVQSDQLSEPKKVIAPPDIDGEPAPYIAPDELRKIRLGERESADTFLRAMQNLLRKKP